MNEPATAFDRRLGLLDATTLVAGSMIGSGIFILLSNMAQRVQAPGVLIGVWVVGGLFTVLGAVCYAELAAMFPRAGGQYVFLREAYGPLPAFLFGWTQFAVIQTGFNAAVAIAFAKYLGRLGPFGGLGKANVLATIRLGRWLPAAVQSRLPEQVATLQINSAQVLACAVIAVLTAVNVRGVREGALVQNLFTLLKVAALVALIAAGLSRLHGMAHFVPLLPGKEMVEAGFLAAVAVALSQALFAYDAWYTVTFVAEEVHDSHRTLPRLGPGHAAGDAGLRAGERGVPGGAAGRRDPGGSREPGGGAGGGGDLWTRGPDPGDRGHPGLDFRLRERPDPGRRPGALAMAREGLFFRGCAVLDAGKTPRTALIYQGVWSMVLALSGWYRDADHLLQFRLGHICRADGGGRLLAPHPAARPPAPHRCWGYPLTPAAYLLICVPFLVYVIQGAAKRRSPACC